MSATLLYRLPKRPQPTIGCAAPSRFRELAEKRKGGAPWEFDADDLQWLQGLIDAGSGIDDTLEQLRGLIDSNGQVVVWTQY